MLNYGFATKPIASYTLLAYGKRVRWLFPRHLSSPVQEGFVIAETVIAFLQFSQHTETASATSPFR